MKLERFKEKNRKRTFIILFTVGCVFLLAGVFLYTSFAVFTEEKQFNVINGKYLDPGDLYFAVYVNGEITNTIPSKDSGYTLDTAQSSCTNGAEITWDNDSWSALVNLSNYSAGNMSRTKCTMYFKEMSFIDSILACTDTAANCIKDNASLSSEIATDDPDNNARYIGADPNNYVRFNNELWRIIGAFNNIDSGSGIKETRLKIIRDEPIGSYSWDNKASGTGSSTSSEGSNDWSDSALQIVLNSGAYYNRTSGQCPYGSKGATVACDFSNTGLTSEAKTMISNAVWNLGGSSTFDDVTASTFYERERGTTVYTGRPTEWTGQIGLMYPSDYGYATSGGNTTDRETCLSIDLYHWWSSSGDSYPDCSMNDWLYDTNYHWTLAHYSSDSFRVFGVYSSGRVHIGYSHDISFSASPTVYLISNIKIIDGEGSRDNPFQLSL